MVYHKGSWDRHKRPINLDESVESGTTEGKSPVVEKESSSSGSRVARST